MAELRKIVPRPALSDFRQQVTPGPNAFDLLSGMAQKAYDFLEPAAIEEMKRKGTADGIAWAKGGGYSFTPSSKSVDPNSPEGIAGDTMAALGKTDDAALSLIRGFEGFRETPYWDVNALRTGYGSDTVTLADGSVQKVTEGTRVSREDADRDLKRRVSTEFAPIARKAVGDAAWSKMTSGQQAALSSIAYNYGEIPSRITEAVRSGDPQAGARAIAALGGDNDGINKGRREKEAAIFAGGALPSGAPAVTASTSGPAPEPVMVRTKDGRVEPRLFSPMSGPILQAHTAAAGTAYISEKMVQGQTDLITMAGEFALNPQGFQQAAEAYIGQMIEDAPDMFRTDLQSELRSQAQRTFLGIVEDQQKDTRQRAANSSAALVERWAGDYTDAIAGGNAEEAAAAEAKLRSVLKTRETLPGLAWTPEQSDNIIFGARDAAAKAIEDNQKAVKSGWKDTLKTMVDAVKNGLTPTGTELLGSPEVQAALPDEWAEVMAMTGFHGALPSFMAAPKDARDATIADMESVPVSDDFQIDIVKAGREANKAVTDAFEKSPIGAASAYLPEKPPAIPDLGSPDAVKGLAARAEYSRRLVETGHAPYLSFFTEEESNSLGLALGKDSPPEARLAAVGAIIEGFGADAPRALAELKMDDPVLKMSGMLMATGGDSATALEAMKGQALLDEGLVQAPSKANTIEAVSADVASALSFAPEGAQGEVMAMATALYAARARGVTDEAQQKTLMEAAVQSALGQTTNKRGETVGGVQEVAGYPVLLPTGVSADAAETAMKAAVGDEGGFWSWAPKVEPKAGAWEAAAGSMPMMGGEPVDPRLFRSDQIRITPVNGSTYRMDYVSGDGTVLQVRNDKGGAFVFDLEKLIEATR